VVTSHSICIPNIGPRERRRRLVGGFVFLLITACVGGGLILFNAPRPWRLLVFLPAWASALGFFQASAKTCVALAARGLKNMDAGDEPITDPTELKRVRAQSRAVHVRAALTAAVVAALFALLSS
jgi:hypothetical protein